MDNLDNIVNHQIKVGYHTYDTSTAPTQHLSEILRY